MLSELRLRNFKVFRQLQLPLKPFTLLAGINGMGKSSVIQALLLLRQSHLSRDLEEGRLLIGGELADLGTGVDLLFDDAERDLISIGLTSQTDHGEKSWDAHFAYDRTADKLAAILEDGSRDRMAGIDLILGPPFKGTTYVHAERWGPRKTMPLSDSRVLSSDFGPKGEFVIHMLLEHGSTLLSSDDPRRKNTAGATLVDQVDAWLQEVSPGSHLSIDPLRSADLAIAGYSFDREGDVPSRVFRATNVGFGLSYVLPVIASLLKAHDGELVLLENPESHLHPRGQTQMGRLAARAAAAGVQVIAETHSDHFMNGVRIEVRERQLSPDSVLFHFFHRNGRDVQVSSPQVDIEGKLTEWPEGFFDQHEENLIELLAPRGGG